MQTLRKYQHDALDRLRAGIRQGMKAQILMLSTGAGKTVIASAMFQSAMNKGKRVLFIVDSIELIDQAANRFISDGMQVGVIQGQHVLTDYSKPVQVATVQTLRNRWEQMAAWMKFDLVVVDEAHVQHNAHRVVMQHCRDAGIPVIGLSATPFRKGLGETFDGLVVGANINDLTEQGFLVPAVCYAPFVPDMKGVKTSGDGDWQADALAEYMGDAQIVGSVVGEWLKLGDGRQTLVFAANRAHARLLYDEFRASGVNADYVLGDTDDEERNDIIARYRSGDITVLVSVGILTKGFDAPETGCIVIARPTKSLMLHIQIIGRGLRPAPGKQDCIVIDLAGNCIRNGLPADELPTALDDGKRKDNPDRKKRDESTPEPKPCGSCGVLKTAHKCPACGFAPESRADVESRDGELVELSTGKAKQWSAQKLATFYAELLGYAKTKGFRAGWAFHKCREYAGRAPRATKSIAPIHPSDDTMRVIKHLQIKAAKRRATA